MSMPNCVLPSRFVPVALAAAIAACSSMPDRDVALDQARMARDAARDSADVRTYAPLEYKRADDTYHSAEAAYNDHQSESTVDHLAYLAKRRSEQALEVGKEKAAEATVAAASAERDRVQLAAKAQEAARAQREARVATMVAEASQAQAIDARRQAYIAQQQADASSAAAIAYQQQAAAATDQTRALQLQLADLQAQSTDHGLVITLGDVLFDTGSDRLREPGLIVVSKLAAFLQQYPARTVEVEGFTDSVGSDAYNQQLSQRRAEAIRIALVNAGIGTERITTHGYGEQYPIASNADPTGRQMNRRVEVVISDASGRIPPQPG
jgi:outer membrane protein OmpA-like peptidoglycan-associated protein